jgi:16S rRNA C967 or C1407 C5-methylase (RsmB/RsmF family)
VLWKDEALLPGLISTQYDLLRHALDHSLLPGGLLVYATYSLLKRKSEGGETIAQTAGTTWNWCCLRPMK